MASYYVHGDTGNDTTGTGTSALPWQTLSKVFSAVTFASGDIVNLAGTIRGGATRAGDTLNLVTFRQWSGQTEYHLRGAQILTGTWINTVGNVWALTVVGHIGASIRGIVVNYDTNTPKAWGQKIGHLRPLTTALAVESTARSFHFDSTTGVYTIDAGGLNPNNQVVERCLGAIIGAALGPCDGCTWEQLRACLFMDCTSGTGNAFRAQGSNNTVSVDWVYDCGHHHVLFADGNCSGNTIIGNGDKIVAGCSNYNGTGTPQTATPLVFHTTAGSQTGNFCQDLTVYGSPCYDDQGVGILTTGTNNLCYSHSTGGIVFDGITWRDIRAIYPDTVGTSSTPFAAMNATRPAADDATEYDGTGFGVLFDHCSCAGGPGMTLSVEASTTLGINFRRCSLRFTDSAAKAEAGLGVIRKIDDANGITLRFEDCEIVCNLGTTATASFFRYRVARLLFLNCSLAEIGTGTNERAHFIPFDSTATVLARQSVFGYVTSAAGLRRFFLNDSGWAASTKNFSGCSYVRVTSYSSDALYNIWAEWVAAIDTAGREEATQPYTDSSVDLRLNPAHALAAVRDLTITPHGNAGINGYPWDGTIGAYQNGGVAEGGGGIGSENVRSGMGLSIGVGI